MKKNCKSCKSAKVRYVGKPDRLGNFLIIFDNGRREWANVSNNYYKQIRPYDERMDSLI